VNPDNQLSPIATPPLEVTERAPGVAVEPAMGCWGTLGVYGDGTCLELQKFIHCRNCPVYSAAGVKLIDRPLPLNYREDWTRHFAQERALSVSGHGSAILFRLQQDWLALPTNAFQEVAERRPIHSLPHRRSGVVLGLANVRGELVICISAAHLLRLGPLPSLATLRSNYRRLLVIQSESSRLAFPVDEVHGPYLFNPQELKAAPAQPTDFPRLVQGLLRWQDRPVALVDAESLFSGLDRTLA
jgi:chemotaxis-related protein WspD